MYADVTEKMATVVPFIRGGLNAGDRCLYVAGPVDQDAARTALADAGVDIAAHELRGSLRFPSVEDYMPAGVTPERAMDHVGKLAQTAKADGFRGLHAAVSRTCLSLVGYGSEWEVHYETQAIERVGSLGVTLLCMVSQTRLESETYLQTCRLHPWVAFGPDVIPNLYYDPPRSGPPELTSAERADRMLSRLRRLHDAETALRERDRQLGVLVRYLPDAILYVSADAHVRFSNPAAEELLGRSRRELEGRPLVDIGLSAAAARSLCEAVERVVRSGRQTDLTVTVAQPGGEKMIDVRLAPERNANGDVLAVVIIGRDVSDLMNAQQERERLYDLVASRVSDLNALVRQALNTAGDDERRRALALMIRDLRPTEVQILRLLAGGHSNQAIGHTLHLSAGTVKNYIVRMLPKLSAANRAQAAARAVELGLLDEAS